MLIKTSKLVFLVRRKSVESILLLARHSSSHEPSIEHRVKMENLLKRRFFFDHSFAIYGGLNGLYDYGPMGCAMKSNLLDEWRRFFVLEEQMLQVDCATLTPLSVLSASGHLTRFVDLMVKDTKTGECFRADHLIEEHLRKILAVNKKLTDEQKLEIEDYLRRVDKMNADEMSQVIRKFAIRAPETENELSEPVAFNLMFSTLIGPTGHIKGFLRPETAQGIFVNFKRLLEFNQGKLPFAAAQIGNSFRNEISPRSGLIRVREFTMAEIEHFVDPQDKSHRKFSQVEDVEVLLYSASKQASGQQPEKMKIGQAVKNKIINNETLGYFIARIHLFLTRCGISSDKLRFRQHMPNEMAHYASDCWDAECQTTYGWIECVGCADRSCFDLTQHAKHSGVRLVAEKKLAQPKMIDVVEAHLDKTSSKKLNKKETKQITAYLDQLTPEEIIRLEDRIKPLNQDDEIEIEIDADKKKKIAIKKSLLAIKRYQKPVSVEEFVPSVIEPSFGIGRIMYAVWEHTFKERDANRSYFSLPALIAPYKCSILPLNTNNDAFKPLINELSLLLTNAGISHKIDDNSGSIGRRYARTDEIAIPFGITIDFDSLNDGSVTLRERDSMQQIRVQMKEVVNLTSDLTNLKTTWSQVLDKYPPIQRSSNDS